MDKNVFKEVSKEEIEAALARSKVIK